MKIYPHDNRNIRDYEHPVFMFIENEFFKFIEANNGRDIEKMYNEPLEELGDDTFLDKHGAILDAIDAICCCANSENKPVDLRAYDLWACFEF